MKPEPQGVFLSLTENLTLFWFAMLVNEYKLYVSIQKS
jgi:hypothetical protein